MRLTSLEHPLINIIALVLITIGWSKHKKEESNNGKFKKIAVFYTLGLVLILSDFLGLIGSISLWYNLW